jgi:hypothetical protein
LIHLEGRLANIAALCAPGGFFNDRPLLRNLFIWGHARVFCNHAIVVGNPELARAEYELVKRTLAQYPPVFLEGVQYDENYEQRLAAPPPPSIWRTLSVSFARLLTRPVDSSKPNGELAMPGRPDSKTRAALYAQEALSHEARDNPLAARVGWHAVAVAAGVLTPEEAGYRTDRKYGWSSIAP